MLVKFEQNRMSKLHEIFELFHKKGFLLEEFFFFNNHVGQRVGALLEDVSVAEIIFNAKLSI